MANVPKSVRLKWPVGPHYLRWVDGKGAHAWARFKLKSADWYLAALAAAAVEAGELDRFVGIEMALDGALSSLCAAVDAAGTGLLEAVERAVAARSADPDRYPGETVAIAPEGAGDEGAREHGARDDGYEWRGWHRGDLVAGGEWQEAGRDEEDLALAVDRDVADLLAAGARFGRQHDDDLGAPLAVPPGLSDGDDEDEEPARERREGDWSAVVELASRAGIPLSSALALADALAGSESEDPSGWFAQLRSLRDRAVRHNVLARRIRVGDSLPSRFVEVPGLGPRRPIAYLRSVRARVEELLELVLADIDGVEELARDASGARRPVRQLPDLAERARIIRPFP